ncbi:MAG: hypothetical protein L0154_13280, partial [Chloroflexi bacterium]|nr:hypothetical protein [Chloroflexota bacterium]
MRRFFISLFIVMFLLTLSFPIAAAQDDLQVVRSSDGRISIRLPSGWTTFDYMEAGSYFIYGSSEAAAQGRLNDFNSQPALLVEEGGFLYLISAEEFGIPEVNDAALILLMEEFLNIVEDGGGQTLEEMAPFQIAGSDGYRSVLQSGNEQGFIAVVGFADHILMVTATGTRRTFDDNRELLETILLSIRIPAEDGVTADQGPEQVDTTDSTLVRSSDAVVSIVIPEGWLHLDELAENNVLAFGSTEAGMQSRRDVALSDDPAAIEVSDSGGVVQLFSFDDVGIDPVNPDVTPLMGQIRNLYERVGFTIVEDPAEFTAGDGHTGQFFIFDSGTQYGYYVLIAFDENIIAMTATGTPDTFTEEQDLLFSVVQSLTSPAAPEPVDDVVEAGEEPEVSERFPGLGTGPAVQLTSELSSPDGGVVLDLPDGWVTFVDDETADYKSILYFAETQDNIDSWINGITPDAPIGVIFVIEGTGVTSSINIDDFFVEVSPEDVDLDKQLAGEFNDAQARWLFYSVEELDGTQYEFLYGLLFMPSEDIVLVFFGAPEEVFPEYRGLYENIFKTLHSSSG